MLEEDSILQSESSTPVRFRGDRRIRQFQLLTNGLFVIVSIVMVILAVTISSYTGKTADVLSQYMLSVADPSAMNNDAVASGDPDLVRQTECAVLNPTTDPPPLREYVPSRATAIKNVNVLVGDEAGTVLSGKTVLIEEGKILAIAENGVDPLTRFAADYYETVEGDGAFLSPGLVDMHSHSGVYSFPDDAWATNDGNEMTNPTMPQVRAVDALDPHDPAITQIVNGGVTTSQVLPGSGNTMGGVSTFIKMWPRSSGRAQLHNMLIPRGNRKIGLKMACGENPKRVYGSRQQTPMSRMGSAWVMRAKLDQARTLQQQQHEWCGAASGSAVDGHLPRDLSLQPLVDLLDGHAILNVHCYKTVDLEMMMRLSEEFNFTIRAFHHAHEAYELAPTLAERGIIVALFADLYGYKMEALEGSVHAAQILHKLGVRVALKSDHPVLHAAELLHEAQKAHHYGLPEAAALAAVTSVPADAIGLSARVGQVKAGLDADLVLWDRHPLHIGARPRLVLIEGIKVVDERESVSKQVDPILQSAPPQVPAPNEVEPSDIHSLCNKEGAPPTEPADDPTIVTEPFSLSQVALYANDDAVAAPGTLVTLAVNQGRILCIAAESDSAAAQSCLSSVDSARRFRAPAGARVTPNFFAADPSASVGDDIEPEDSARDGNADGSINELLSVRAADGAHSGSRLSQGIWRDGIVYSLRAPFGSARTIRGLASVLRTGDGWYGEAREAELAGSAQAAADSTWPVGSDASPHGTPLVYAKIGANSRSDSGLGMSRSGQIAELRSFLLANSSSSSSSSYASVSSSLTNLIETAAALRSGNAILLVHAHHADDIGAVLRIKGEYAGELSALRLVFVGAAEAHLYAKELNRANAGVILSPPRCYKARTFDQLRCLPSAAKVLAAENVPLALASDDVTGLRGALRWSAGWLRAWGQLTDSEALQAVSSVPAELLGVAEKEGAGFVRVGKRASFTLWNADPLDFSSRPILITDGVKTACAPDEPHLFAFHDPVGWEGVKK